LNSMINRVLGRFDFNTQELLRGSSIAFILKIVGAGIAFGLNVLLARFLGAEGAGIYFLALTIVMIAATIGRFGLDNVLVKFISSSVSRENSNDAAFVYKKSMIYACAGSSTLTGILVYFGPALSLSLFEKPLLIGPLFILSFAVLPLALLTLHSYALQGLKEIAKSTTILNIAVPSITCIFVILFVPRFGIEAATISYLFATIITLLIGRQFWNKTSHLLNNPRNNTTIGTSDVVSSSRPLFGVALIHIIIKWSPILLLGIWGTSENVGIFSVASKTAALTSFILVAVNSIASPKFAAIYEQRDMNALRSVTRAAIAISLLFACPLIFIFTFYPEEIMSLFGEDFSSGSDVLTIIALGQLVNVATGPVNQLLIMTGNEKQLFSLLLCSGIFSLLLYIPLVYYSGMYGAAIGGFISSSLINMLGFYFVKKKLRLNIFWGDPLVDNKNI
jgi:O-antigen/teichoic acid export membrane protein